MNDDAITQPPERMSLLVQISHLRDGLADYLAELHDLESVVKPNLLAHFQSRLGPWELRLMEARCDFARWKRKCEMIQSAINRNEMPNSAAMEAALDHEFLTWQQKILESSLKINDAQFRLSHFIEDDSATELKKLFRELAKAMHPDVNPNASPEEQTLWLHMMDAYERGDLSKLRALALACGKPSDDHNISDLEALRNERDRLRERLHEILGKLAGVKSQPPFSMSQQWHDDAWIEQRRAELESETAATLAAIDPLKQRAKSLLAIHGSNQKPDSN